jgi:hypothetical protein
MSVLVLPALRLSASSILAGLAGLLVLANGGFLMLENSYDNQMCRQNTEKGRQNYKNFLARIDKPEFASSIDYVCSTAYSRAREVNGHFVTTTTGALLLRDNERTLFVQYKGRKELELLIYPSSATGYSECPAPPMNQYGLRYASVYWSSHRDPIYYEKAYVKFLANPFKPWH